VKIFHTALQKVEKVSRFKGQKIFLRTRNDLAFKVSDVQFGKALLKKRPQGVHSMPDPAERRFVQRPGFNHMVFPQG
jgi:hypothetical protein